MFKDTNGVENMEKNQDIIKKTGTIWRKKSIELKKYAH